jgi:hypothetical protein
VAKTLAQSDTDDARPASEDDGARVIIFLHFLRGEIITISPAKQLRGFSAARNKRAVALGNIRFAWDSLSKKRLGRRVRRSVAVGDLPDQAAAELRS